MDDFYTAALLALYGLPIIVAGMRNHPQAGPIAIINIFLGWTFIGWVIALAWSASGQNGKRKPEGVSNGG
jgi:hypothetical protein